MRVVALSRAKVIAFSGILCADLVPEGEEIGASFSGLSNSDG